MDDAKLHYLIIGVHDSTIHQNTKAQGIKGEEAHSHTSNDGF